jgi:glyceraldehyde-3-phosphate dehydrogenase/erythrose-4-phosphate dehydrogenase
MSLRVGINGFGRIGRSFTRALLARGLMGRRHSCSN